MVNYKVFKTEREADMANKFNYIKRSTKYIIGAAVLVAGLGSAAFGLDKGADGYYEIRNKDDLKKFASKVNNGECDAKGKLMNDIVFNENVVKNGVLQDGDFDNWIPIGTYNNQFKGKFECDGKMITGIYK